MRIDRLHLENFKNYESLKVDFHEKIICLVGLNGMGKTNILDAIHYLAYTKSALGVSDLQVIRKGSPYFLSTGKFSGKNDLEVKCYLEKEGKKLIKVNEIELERISDHIGNISVVLSSPYDHDIVHGPGEIRRKWVDGCIASHDHNYLEQLLKYKKLLRQRNALLKQSGGQLSRSAKDLLETYDIRLIAQSGFLADHRKEFLERLEPYFDHRVIELVEEKEKIKIDYQSKVNDDFENYFRSQLPKDLITCRTNAGIHKDEFSFSINGNPLKKFGSQGQQKSFLIAIRLAQYDYLSNMKKEKPILLLDDVFDKLDDERIQRISQILKKDKGIDQVFITDARKERSLSFFDEKEKTKIIELDNGKIKGDG
ncbi:recF [Symbiodinium microadriaticum]|nr:recF [Symbiodinium microadriaticum]